MRDQSKLQSLLLRSVTDPVRASDAGSNFANIGRGKQRLASRVLTAMNLQQETLGKINN